MEREGRLLAKYLSDWANIHKTAHALSRVCGMCITVSFTAKSVAVTSSALANY